MILWICFHFLGVRFKMIPQHQMVRSSWGRGPAVDEKPFVPKESTELPPQKGYLCSLTVHPSCPIIATISWTLRQPSKCTPRTWKQQGPGHTQNIYHLLVLHRWTDFLVHWQPSTSQSFPSFWGGVGCVAVALNPRALYIFLRGIFKNGISYLPLHDKSLKNDSKTKIANNCFRIPGWPSALKQLRMADLLLLSTWSES